MTLEVTKLKTVCIDVLEVALQALKEKRLKENTLMHELFDIFM